MPIRRPADARSTAVRPRRRDVLAIAGGAAALPLIGGRARAAEPIRIGWVGPLSPPGGYAEGTNMKNAAALAVEQINARGGVLGRPVEVTYADTRGMPAEGRTAAERLVQDDKVVAVFGEFHSPVALAEMEVFHGMSVDVFAGEVRCVLGPNGTGKSTLPKVLCGFLPPLAGEMRLGATLLHNVAPHRMGALGITYLPQRPSLFPHLSVEVNLRLGTWSFRRNRALARQRIERAYAQFPVLSEHRWQAAGTLSGGQPRQLEIARALLTDPKVMLMDEPTASIEPRIAAQIYVLISGLARDDRKAILLVDQNVTGALGIADYVYVMRTGSLLEEGRRADFTGDVPTLVSRWLYTRPVVAGR